MAVLENYLPIVKKRRKGTESLLSVSLLSEEPPANAAIRCYLNIHRKEATLPQESMEARVEEDGKRSLLFHVRMARLLPLK